MGTVAHHQDKTQCFLHRARDAVAAGDAIEAANALRRAASHAATALAVHTGFRHNTTRRLETALFNCISAGRLSRSHLKTFRHTYTLPDHLRDSDDSRPGHRNSNRGKPPERRPDPAHPACAIPLRRMRRRVTSMVKSIDDLIAGKIPSVRFHKRYLRGLPPREIHPAPVSITSIRDILDLPNRREIAETYGLQRDPLVRRPDPHGMYAAGCTPRPCSCHPETANDLSETPTRVHLSPLWQKALERALRTTIPSVLLA